VNAEVRFLPLKNDNGRAQAGVEVTCTQCGHIERAFGEGPRSVKRCLAMLRENCPEDETNFYTVEDRYLEDD
jgi:hypothetical protein